MLNISMPFIGVFTNVSLATKPEPLTIHLLYMLMVSDRTDRNLIFYFILSQSYRT